MNDLQRYKALDEAAIPPGGVPPSHKKLDTHGALDPTRSPTICLALGRENPAEYVEAFAPIREISVVRESGWCGPFSPPTYSIYASTKVKARLYEQFESHTGKRVRGDLGRDRYYYGFPSVGYWHRWEEWRRESGPFVSIRKMEIPRLIGEHGYGEIMWMGIGGWTVSKERENESADGGWILRMGDKWATKGQWEPGDGLPQGVEESFDRAKKDLCETIMGRRLSDEEYENLAD